MTLVKKMCFSALSRSMTDKIFSICLLQSHVIDEMIPQLSARPLYKESWSMPISERMANTKGMGKIFDSKGRRQCPHCDKSYVDASGLKQHMQKHTGHFSYWCEECQKGLYNKSHYEAHMAAHKGIDYPCNMCTKRFRSLQTLNKHLTDKHC